MNRRELLKSVAGLTGAAALKRSGWSAPLARNPETDTLEVRLAHDPRRPQFHLLPKRNWMNDPNGPIYWNGKYHMFFQYNPNAAVWGDMHWAHALSLDMVHWRHLPIALAPTPGGPDAAGCFSGSAVVNNGVVTVLYTGVVNSPLDEATIRDGLHSLRESQCLATSIDQDLQTWKKLSKPVIPAPPPGMKITGFRDPSPWKSGDWWYLALGSGVLHKGGAVLLYRSKDLRHWDYLHYVASGQGDGKSAVNPVNSGDMWECPDLFPLDGKHVLIYSAEGKVYWQTGVLDETAMRFHPEKYGILDYGAYYAAKTQKDAHGQRIVWGWIQETRPEAEYKAAGWACMMSLPRVLRLHPGGELSIQMHPVLNKLRRQEKKLVPGPNARTQLSQLCIPSATGELLGMFTRNSRPFTISLAGRLPHEEIAQSFLTLEYDPAHPDEILADGKTIPLAGSDLQHLKIHIYVDGSVAEVILQDTAAYTKRFYYAGETAPDVYLKMDGPPDAIQSLSVWQIEPISNDRLTS